MTDTEPHKTDSLAKVQIRLLSHFSFYFGLTVFVLAAVINFGLYINCDTVPGEAINPYPMVGKIVKVLGYVAFPILIGSVFSFLATILAPFAQPRLRNFVVALVGFLLAFAAGHMLVFGFERGRHSPANNIAHLNLDLREYTEKHAGQLPSTNWCDDLLSFQSEHTTYIKNIVRRNPECLIGYGMNNNIGGKILTDLPPETVLLFETEPAKNTAGGPELMNTKNHFSKGCFVLFANNQIKFVRPEDFNNLRWKP